MAVADDAGVFMLTTIDNPFDPFTQWDSWFMEDARLGYNTPGLIARIAFVSENLSEPDQAKAVLDAIDEIATINASGVHKKVSSKS